MALGPVEVGRGRHTHHSSESPGKVAPAVTPLRREGGRESRPGTASLVSSRRGAANGHSHRLLDRRLDSAHPVHAAWPPDNIPPEPPARKRFGPLQLEGGGSEGTEVSAHVSWLLCAPPRSPPAWRAWGESTPPSAPGLVAPEHPRTAALWDGFAGTRSCREAGGCAGCLVCPKHAGATPP